MNTEKNPHDGISEGENSFNPSIVSFKRYAAPAESRESSPRDCEIKEGKIVTIKTGSIITQGILVSIIDPETDLAKINVYGKFYIGNLIRDAK